MGYNRNRGGAQRCCVPAGKSLPCCSLSRQQPCGDEKGGEDAAYNGHKKRRGVKVHAAVSAEGLPLSLVIGAGNEHDSRRFTDVLEGIRIRTSGRPRTRPREVVAEAAYDEGRIRGYLRRRGIRSTTE